MSIEPAAAVRMVGLPVVGPEESREFGVVTDVSIDEDGRIDWIHVRLRWLSGQRCLPAGATRLLPDALRSLKAKDELEQCGPVSKAGLVGQDVTTHEGEALGRVANVLVTAEDYMVVALELSNGRLKDWARGRVTVALPPDETFGESGQHGIVLSEEAHTVHLDLSVEGGGEKDSTQVQLPIQKTMDWEKIRQTPEVEMCSEMARVVWERRGAPKDGPDTEEWSEQVAPWVQALKTAADEGGSSEFDDLALLSSEQVEAFRLYRVGAQPVERHVGANADAVSTAPGEIQTVPGDTEPKPAESTVHLAASGADR